MPDPAGGCALGRTCKEILDNALADGNGIYPIDPDGYDAGTPPFDVYCDMVEDGGGWTMVYKLSKDIDHDIYGLWVNSGTLNEGEVGMLDLDQEQAHYKNRLLDNYWNDNGIALSGAMVYVLVDGVPVKTLRFDAQDTDKTNWYTKARTSYSSWTDLVPTSQNYFSIGGDSGNGRHWFINSSYAGCPNDYGWLVVDRPGHPCNWETKRDPPISILYSTTEGVENWDGGNMAEAHAFAVFVR